MDSLILGSRLFRGVLERLIKKAIANKFGVDVVVELGQITMLNKDGKVHVHLEGDVDMSSDDLNAVLKEVI